MVGGVKTAEFWHREEGGFARCDLCPHRCRIAEGKTGLCRVRRLESGELKAVGYGLVSSAAMDPIEKKPLYHFCPGTMIFSVGGWGCNFACRFCQNWTISQRAEESGRRYGPRDIVAAAQREGSSAIAYTYNEPLVGLEFVRDCAALAAEQGLANVLVTNGYVLPEAAAAVLPFVQALNLDIKSMDEGLYREQCHGSLKPVLDFACQARAAGCHVEITNLVIPGLNDDDSGFAALAAWMAEHLGAAAPLHLSAYRPEFRMQIPPTPAATLDRARGICRKHLQYVYVGNVVTGSGQNTECPGCSATLVARSGYATRVVGIRDGACARCGRRADLVVPPGRPQKS
jgi:pyruvate formate lyase activating enzyme